MNEPKEIHGFNLGTKSQSGFSLKEKLLRFRVYIRLIGYDKERKNIGIEGEYVIEFLYKIENLDDFITHTDKEGEFSVGVDLGATIAGISYSTSRGIVLDRTQGTYFNGVLLPILDPKDLLEIDSFTEITQELSR